MAQDSDGSKVAVWDATGPLSAAALAQVRQIAPAWAADHANADHHLAGRLVARLLLTLDKTRTQLAECEAHNRDLLRDLEALATARDAAGRGGGSGP